MIQVPDVLAHKSLAVDDQRDGIFQVGAQRENGTLGGKGCNRARSVTTRAAQDYRAEGTDARHRVVHSAGNRPLPDQKGVRDSRETMQRVFVLVSDWLT